MHTLLSEILVFFHNYEFFYYIIEQKELILRIVRIVNVFMIYSFNCYIGYYHYKIYYVLEMSG